MVDNKELNDLLTATQITLLNEIRILSEISSLINDIKMTADKYGESYKLLIRHRYILRETLKKHFKEFEDKEQDLWDKIQNITLI